MEHDDIEDDIGDCIACGEASGAEAPTAARTGPVLCAGCAVAGSRPAAQSPSTLGASDGTYRLGSWWRDGSSRGL